MNLDDVWTEQTAADMEAMADYIEQHGWTQHVQVNAAGQVCLHGAISEVCSNQDHRGFSRASTTKAVLALRSYLATVDPRGPSLAAWNDQPKRTADEVVTACRKAAIYVREQM